MCQYDDTWNDYVNVTRAVYKAMSAVRKDPGSGAIVVASTALRVEDLKGCSTPLFPIPDNPHNRCFLTIDPLKHTVHVLYAPFVPFW